MIHQAPHGVVAALRCYSFDRKVYDRAARKRQALGIVVGVGLEASRRGGTPAVTPLTIITSVTVTHWYRADLGITLNSGKVSAWANQVGGGSAATQATATKQPVYNAADASISNRPSMTFDGVDDALATVTPAANPTWACIVAKYNNLTNTAAALLGASDGQFLAYNNGATAFAVYNGAFNVSQGVIVSTWFSFLAYWTGTVATYSKTGSAAKVIADAGSNTSAGVWMISGGNPGNPVNYAATNIAEVVMCSGGPNSTEQTAMAAYVTTLYAGTVQA